MKFKKNNKVLVSIGIKTLAVLSKIINSNVYICK